MSGVTISIAGKKTMRATANEAVGRMEERHREFATGRDRTVDAVETLDAGIDLSFEDDNTWADTPNNVVTDIMTEVIDNGVHEAAGEVVESRGRQALRQILTDQIRGTQANVGAERVVRDDTMDAPPSPFSESLFRDKLAARQLQPVNVDAVIRNATDRIRNLVVPFVDQRLNAQSRSALCDLIAEQLSQMGALEARVANEAHDDDPTRMDIRVDFRMPRVAEEIHITITP